MPSLLEALDEVQDSQSGKTYLDAISLHMLPFPSDMHDHTWEVTQVLPLLKDQCVDSPDDCQTMDYLEFMLDNASDVNGEVWGSDSSFLDWWVHKVSTDLSLDSDAVAALYGDKDQDEHDSWNRVSAMEDYGLGLGIDHVPEIFINDVQ